MRLQGLQASGPGSGAAVAGVRRLLRRLLRGRTLAVATPCGSPADLSLGTTIQGTATNGQGVQLVYRQAVRLGGVLYGNYASGELAGQVCRTALPCRCAVLPITLTLACLTTPVQTYTQAYSNGDSCCLLPRVNFLGGGCLATGTRTASVVYTCNVAALSDTITSAVASTIDRPNNFVATGNDCSLTVNVATRRIW